MLNANYLMKILCILFGNLLLLIHIAIAQNNEAIDSLSQMLKSRITEKEKVDTYIDIADEYLYSDHTNALKSAEKAMEISEKINYQEGKVEALTIQALVKKSQGQLVEAEQLFQKIIQLAESASYKKGVSYGYYGLGRILEINGNYEQALAYYFQSLKIAKENDKKQIIANLHNTIGIVYKALGNFDSALSYYRLSLNTQKELGNERGAAYCLNNIGVVLSLQGSYDQALDYHLQSLKIQEAIQNKIGIAQSYDNIGVVYKELGSYDQALKYQYKSLEISEEIKDHGEIADCYNSIGEIHMSLGNVDSALVCYNKSLAFSRQVGNKRETAISYKNLGILYKNESDYTKSLDYASRALKIYQEMGAKAEEIYPLITLGEIFYLQEKYLNARRNLLKAIHTSQEIGLNENIKHASQILSKVEEALGNHRKALEYHKIYKQMSDSLFNLKNTQAITHLEAKFKFQQEKDSIYFANRQEKLVEERKEEVKLVARFVVFLMLLTIIFTLYRFYRLKKKANQLLREQQEKITQQRDELASMDQHKSRFFANISHELRTPLTLIKGPLENVMEREQNILSVKSKKDLQLIRANTRKLEGFVNDILNLSKLDANKLTVNNEEVSIHGFLTRVFEGFRSLTNSLGIDYQLTLDKLPDSTILLDATKLEKVLNNLLSNAIKHTPKGKKIEMIAYEKGNQLMIRVTDTGRGISSADLPHLFDRYFQSKQPDAPIQGGTGIGLALAKEYLSLMKGSLKVESIESQGTTFTASLPLITAANGTSAKTPLLYATPVINEESLLDNTKVENNQAKTSGHRVLIVEDQPDMLQFIKDLLQDHHQVAVAMNGKEALKYLSKNKVDLIVSDVMMPEMDGFELLRNARNNKTLQQIPFIILTALEDEQHQLKALSMGVDDYLTKPFTPAELLARVNNMLERFEVRKSLMTEPGESVDEPQSENLTNKGQEFISRLERIIIDELENEKFSMTAVAEDFFMSYSQFSKKVKKLTGLSPKHYQQEIAMQKARELLESNKFGNLTAVSQSVGIQNVTHFRKQYQKRFGKCPTEFFEEVIG